MTVYFRPCGDITRAPEPRGAGDLALLGYLEARTGLLIEIDPSVDYEDWMEPATMLVEALKRDLETVILSRRPLREAVVAPVATIAGKPCRDMLIGRQNTSDPHEMAYFDLGWPAADTNLANHYAELEAFQARAGRRLQLADMPGDREAAGGREPIFGKGLTSTTLGAAMCALAPGKIVVKQVYPGKALPVLRYDVPADATEKGAENLFIDEVGYHIFRFEGDPAALLVQEAITMTHETRFFVIDGRVVTGAACIERNTPQQGDREVRMKSEWEITRNSGVMDERGLVARGDTQVKMWIFAEEAVAAISAEAPQLRHYTLDVALDGDGEPLIIELNPADNAGLYGISARHLFHAIHRAAEAAPAREPLAWDREETRTRVEARAADVDLRPNPELRAALLGELAEADSNLVLDEEIGADFDLDLNFED